MLCVLPFHHDHGHVHDKHDPSSPSLDKPYTVPESFLTVQFCPQLPQTDQVDSGVSALNCYTYLHLSIIPAWSPSTEKDPRQTSEDTPATASAFEGTQRRRAGAGQVHLEQVFTSSCEDASSESYTVPSQKTTVVVEPQSTAPQRHPSIKQETEVQTSKQSSQVYKDAQGGQFYDLCVSKEKTEALRAKDNGFWLYR
ncbi:hypothetical protein MG293_007962 [Ovis ammon polii]|uniref:Uncharacterized protein n=1 Tax=Ovis ammon polii TaxID=230172 RepID=A0AAD4U8T7_OVIAM|nr:hypothetical protein MG293_007962 [Ovis ammon polii]